MTRIQHPAPAPWLLAAALPTVIAVGSYAFWAVPTPPNLRPDSFSYLFYLTAGAFDEGRNAGYATFLILVHKLVGLDRLPTLRFLARVFSPGICWSGLSLKRLGSVVHRLQMNS